MPPKLAGCRVICEKDKAKVRIQLGEGCPKLTIHARYLIQHFKCLEVFIKIVSTGSEDEEDKITIDVKSVRGFLRKTSEEEPMKVLAMLKDAKNTATSEA